MNIEWTSCVYCLVIAGAALSQVVILCGVLYVAYYCIKLKRAFSIVKDKLSMDCEELLEELLLENTETPVSVPQTRSVSAAEPRDILRKRTRLDELANYGRAMRYKGRVVTSELIDAMEDDEVVELTARYEARLGAAMSKSLGSTLLNLYISAASAILPIPPSQQPKLLDDLRDDPFISSALRNVCCELYYRYGMYLAPLTAAITTAKYCDRDHIEDSGANSDSNAESGTGDSGCGAEDCGRDISLAAEGERP